MVGTEPRHTSSHAETSPRRGDTIRPPGSAIVDHAEVRAGGQPFGVASLKPAHDQCVVATQPRAVRHAVGVAATLGGTVPADAEQPRGALGLSLIHISEPTRLGM